MAALHGAFLRDVFSHVPATRVREVSHMLKAIHAQESRQAADRKARAIVDDLAPSSVNFPIFRRLEDWTSPCGRPGLRATSGSAT